MDNDLHKLKIDKSHKASRDERSVWPWVAIIVCLLVIAFAGWQWAGTTTAATVETVRVRASDPTTVTTDGADDVVSLQATGYIMAAHKIELASKVVGRVAWVGVEMGDKVDKGQVLVRLEDDEYKARVVQQEGQLESARAKLAELEAGSRPEELAQAMADVEKAKAELANAELNFNRLKELEASRSVSRQQVDDAEALMRSRKAQVESLWQAYSLWKAGPRKEQVAAQRAVVKQLDGGVSLAKIDLDNTIIRAPVNGTILARNVEVGEYVTTGFVGDNGAKGYVVSLADLTDLRVELDISQNDFAKVKPAGPCRVTTDAYPDRKYGGVVDLISPEANRQKATVLVRVKVLEPDDLLKPDMNATVSFLALKKPAAQSTTTPTSESERPAIRVPASAVLNSAVFVVEDGRVVRRTITLGARTMSGEVEVRSGLIGGEDLVVRPSDTLKDGDRVKISSTSG
jgi:HlyD family secretion protein